MPSRCINISGRGSAPANSGSASKCGSKKRSGVCANIACAGGVPGDSAAMFSRRMRFRSSEACCSK